MDYSAVHKLLTGMLVFLCLAAHLPARLAIA